MASSPSNIQDRAGAPRTRPLVLITDDHEDTRLMLSVVLKMRGYAVIEAADGEQAVRLAESAGPDLILMDGSLPLVDGLAATRRIRRAGRAGRVPIVFVSGHAEPAYRVVAVEAGCDEYLVKPLDMEQLGGVLEKYLGRNARAFATQFEERAF
jgi:DNA-binding response OmpR family regulator